MSKDTKAATKAPGDEGDLVPRNEFGGVYVDEEELRAAFDFFDVHKKGTLVCLMSVSVSGVAVVAAACVVRGCGFFCTVVVVSCVSVVCAQRGVLVCYVYVCGCCARVA